jgi:hypothetical protein
MDGYEKPTIIQRSKLAYRPIDRLRFRPPDPDLQKSRRAAGFSLMR